MTTKSMPASSAWDAVIAIKNAIDANPFQRTSIQELAPDIHIGRNQLQNTFKEITGLTIRTYRLQKRMEAASNLLSSGERSVKQIAWECGYRNQNNFTADFKLIFKITPAEWLHNHLDDNPNVTEHSFQKVQFS